MQAQSVIPGRFSHRGPDARHAEEIEDTDHQVVTGLVPGLHVNNVAAATVACAGAVLASFAFARVDVAWLVTWTWDRLALLPLAALLPALFEAAAEPFETGSEPEGSAPAAP